MTVPLRASPFTALCATEINMDKSVAYHQTLTKCCKKRKAAITRHYYKKESNKPPENIRKRIRRKTKQ